MHSIVVVTYRSEKHIRNFIESAQKYSPDAELIIVDNSGRDYGIPGVIVNESGSYPSGLNQGIAASSGKIIACCNPDIILSESWLEKLTMTLDDFSIACPVSNFASGVQGQIKNFPPQVLALHVRFFIGFCFALRRTTYQNIGQFDEQFSFEQDDLDYSIMAAKSGAPIGVNPQVFIEHVGHQSAVTDPSSSDKRWLSLYRLLKKHSTFDIAKLGAGWGKQWLDTVAEKYPDVTSLESYQYAYRLV